MTFNLTKGSYKPYKNPKDTLLHINKNSYHLPQITKKLPKASSDRLCRNSSNAETFQASKVEYAAALKSKNIDFKDNLVNKNNSRQKGKGISYGLTRHLAKQC